VTPNRRWTQARFAAAAAFVALLTVLDGAMSATLAVLYVPIVALASAASARVGAMVAVLSIGLYVGVLAFDRGWGAVLELAIVPVAVVVFLAVGTRRIVASLERSLARMRHAIEADRRRARRLRAIEQVRRILAQDGPSPAALGSIMDVLVGTFGYRYPSVYLWTGTVLRLGAHRGYEHPIVEFDLQLGIIGRVARTREAAYVPNVALDPDYAVAFSDVVSEISVPLLADGELLGVLNVESTAAQVLGRDDLASLRTIADRLSASIELGRERQKLAERAALLGRLADAFAEFGATLDASPLHAAIARAATTVVRSDVGLLTLLDGLGAEYRVVAAEGADMPIGMKIDPGEGATGKAIADRAAVLADHFDRYQVPRTARIPAAGLPEVAVMAIPLLRSDAAVGAITFVRTSAGEGFTDQEREIGGLLAGQAALAIANASLHAAAREAAIRDPLTGLHNRRLLDDAVARMDASRMRQAPAERRPMAAIMFDLDHFGDLNNRHGHSAGDAVLRAFAGLLAGRFRAADLVARYGGEEFLVVLDGASRDDAIRAAEGVRIAFRELDVPVAGGEVLRATVSAGCASLDPSLAPLDTMFELADVGLAMAKAGGRDQVVAA
jgi:diguanylate cyclase (GGDEF)-like protein